MDTYPDIVPSFTTKVEEDDRTLVAMMGDGYEQRMRDGINSARLRFEIAYNKRRSAAVATVLAFLRAHGGRTAFLWTPPAPFDTERQWVIRPPWQYEYVAYDCENLVFVIEEDFNPPL